MTSPFPIWLFIFLSPLTDYMCRAAREKILLYNRNSRSAFGHPTLPCIKFDHPAKQMQSAVTVYCKREQLLLFAYIFQISWNWFQNQYCVRGRLWVLLYVGLCTIAAISRQKKARSRDYALLLFRITPRVIYSAQYNRKHCTLDASLEHCTICTTTMTNIRPDRDSNLVPPG